MSSAALDNLAVNGVLNFDADAYIKGTPPRYIGHPNNGNGIPFEQPLPYAPMYPPLGAQLPHQPIHDEFKSESHNKPVGWKEVLTLGIVGSLAVAAGLKFKKGIVKLFSKKAPKVTTPPPATSTAASTTAKKSKSITNLFNWFKNSKPAKITAAVAVGLLGLYGLYDFITKRKASAHFAAGTPSPTLHAAPAQHAAPAEHA